MAKKQKARVIEPVKMYYVTDDKVGTKLGPHDVQELGGGVRFVMLTARQAKFYETQAVISAQL